MCFASWVRSSHAHSLFTSAPTACLDRDSQLKESGITSQQALGRERQSSDRLWRNRAEPLTLPVGRFKASQSDSKMRSPPRSCSTQRCRSQERRGISASEGGQVAAPVSCIRQSPSPPSFVVPSQCPKCSLPTSYFTQKSIEIGRGESSIASL